MRKTLDLAQKGEGRVNPDPLVGAIVVKEGEIVGEGYYSRSGGKHAETKAIQSAGKEAEDSDLYVNLEPCVDFPGKRTPSCAEMIIESGVERVCIGMEDPNPEVRGKGVEKLEKAGIKTEVGILEIEAEKLNEIYRKYITTGKPFVLLKMAMTADGKSATRTGDSRWISGEESRRLVHRLRNRYSTVAVGVNTVIQDNPRLTVRKVEGKNPIRLILDSRGRTPLDSNVLNEEGETVVATTRSISPQKEKELKKNCEIWKLDSREGKVDLELVVKKLVGKGMDSLMVEGGGELASSFLKEGLVDKVMLFIAPKVVGGRESKTAVEGEGVEGIEDALRLKKVSVRRVGEDIVYEGYPEGEKGGN